jgi:hypothetical protein
LIDATNLSLEAEKKRRGGMQPIRYSRSAALDYASDGQKALRFS